jgi:hypothetical protein
VTGVAHVFPHTTTLGLVQAVVKLQALVASVLQPSAEVAPIRGAIKKSKDSLDRNDFLSEFSEGAIFFFCFMDV